MFIKYQDGEAADHTDCRCVLLDQNEWSDNEDPVHLVRDRVEKELEDQGIEIEPHDSHDAAPSGWKVEIETGISLEPLQTPEGQEPGFRWAGLEIVSPVLVADEAEQRIRHIMGIIKAKYEVHISPICGLHIHVGVGARKKIPTDVLRRFGALLWAAEPLLTLLDPPERLLNPDLRSVRLQSHLALGNVQKDDDDDIEGEAVPPTPLSCSHQRFLEHLDPIEARHLLYKGNPWDDPDATERHKTFAYEDCERRPKPILQSVYPAALKLLSCEYPSQVARLLACKEITISREVDVRANFNFTSAYLRSDAKRHTVEFRQAAGSFDPDRVVTWTEICTRLLRFAVDHTDAELLTLLDLLHRDEMRDVFQFLEYIGCSRPCVENSRSRVAQADVRGWYEEDIYNLAIAGQEDLELSVICKHEEPCQHRRQKCKAFLRRSEEKEAAKAGAGNGTAKKASRSFLMKEMQRDTGFLVNAWGSSWRFW